MKRRPEPSQLQGGRVERATPQGMAAASRSAFRWALLLLVALWQQVTSRALSVPSRCALGLTPASAVLTAPLPSSLVPVQ